MSMACRRWLAQDALDRAAVVPNALRALAYAFTATAAEPAEAGLLTWDTITEALLQVGWGGASPGSCRLSLAFFSCISCGRWQEWVVKC